MDSCSPNNFLREHFFLDHFMNFEKPIHQLGNTGGRWALPGWSFSRMELQQKSTLIRSFARLPPLHDCLERLRNDILILDKKFYIHPLFALKFEIPNSTEICLAFAWSMGPVTGMSAAGHSEKKSRTMLFMASLSVFLHLRLVSWLHFSSNAFMISW